MRLPVLFAGLLTAASALAEAPTLHWSVPLPAGQPWRIVDLREGRGVRHEEYIPRGQGIEDYRDRILVQRFAAQDMSPETYLGHIASGLHQHCAGFTTSGLVVASRDGLPSASRSAYCGLFEGRPYGYVIAQKAILDGPHLFVVEREWRLPGFSIDPDGMPRLSVGSAAEDEALKREVRLAMRWLVERIQPLAPPEPPSPRPAARR